MQRFFFKLYFISGKKNPYFIISLLKHGFIMYIYHLWRNDLYKIWVYGINVTKKKIKLEQSTYFQ